MAQSRRSFIKKAAAGIGLFTILPREVFGKMGGNNNYVAPSDQLTRGIIGTGGIGMSSLPWWEIALSVAILALSTVGTGVLGAKIYRVGVLLYGTPPKLSAIFKALKQA